MRNTHTRFHSARTHKKFAQWLKDPYLFLSALAPNWSTKSISLSFGIQVLRQAKRKGILRPSTKQRGKRATHRYWRFRPNRMKKKANVLVLSASRFTAKTLA